MKLFADTANVQEIEVALDRGIIDGVTTNPSIIAKAAKDLRVPLTKAFVETQIKKITDVMNGTGMHLSVEVWSRAPSKILEQARHFRDTFNYKDLSVKVHIGWDELKLIKELTKEGTSVNCTCCMTPTQALLAAKAGAAYVSLFVGRIRDLSCMPASDKVLEASLQSGDKDHIQNANERLKREAAAMEKRIHDLGLRGVIGGEEIGLEAPFNVIGMTRALLEAEKRTSKIIAGSIRGADDVKKSWLAGAHIVTAQPKFFKDMLEHPKTDEVIGQFLNDFKPLLEE